jgi:hypothetical protein
MNKTNVIPRPGRLAGQVEGPCGYACRIEELKNHKVPPAYSRADDHPNTRTSRVPGTPEESARSSNGRRDDGIDGAIAVLTQTLAGSFY